MASLMHDPPRPRDSQLLLTRGHLYAMALLSCGLAAVAFFLGIQIGRQQAPLQETEAPHVLVSQEASEGQLEVLLARVDQAQSSGQTLTFPSDLPNSRSMPALPIPEGTGVPIPGIPTLTPQSDGTPTSGWSIEISILPDLIAAEAELARLRGLGLTAYRISTIVEGIPRHHIRIGGFGNEKDAIEAQTDIMRATGARKPIVLKAP